MKKKRLICKMPFSSLSKKNCCKQVLIHEIDPKKYNKKRNI